MNQQERNIQDFLLTLPQGLSEVEKLVEWDRSRWKRIEDAPRDGTPLLMYSPYPKGESGNTANGLIWVSGGWRKDWDGWRGDYGKPEPTHYLPLPAQPQEEQE